MLGPFLSALCCFVCSLRMSQRKSHHPEQAPFSKRYLPLCQQLGVRGGSMPSDRVRVLQFHAWQLTGKYLGKKYLKADLFSWWSL